jgi:hypothetical protein
MIKFPLIFFREVGMKLIVCTDSRGGISFFGRRIASDRLVTMDIIREGNGRLLIAPFSEKILKRAIEAHDFTGKRDETNYTVSESPLETAGAEDAVFVEDRPIRPFLQKIDTLIVYNLNLPYPFDKKLDIDPAADGFKLISVTEFPGNSHDIVTKSVYKKI